jgi:type I restriction enzyme, S subunit
MENNKPQFRFNGFDEDWENYYLKSLCENIEYGLNAASKPYDGINKYIRITDINDETRKFLVDDVTSPNLDLSKANNFLLQKGDVLFARTGASVGKSYHYDEKDGKVYYAGFLIRARIKNEINSELVFQNTLTEKYNKFIQITSQRSGQPGVNAQEYGEFSFHLPKNKTEQQKIGNFFENLDKLLTEHQQKHNKLKALKKAMLSKMFPQQGQTVPEIRFKGFVGDWEEKKLSSEVDFFSGLTYSPLDIVKTDGTFVIRSSNIKNGQFVDADNVYVNTDKVNCEFVKKNDIAVVVRNGSRDLIGKHALLYSNDKNTVIGAFMTGIRSEIPYFINALLDSNQFKIEINKNLGATINQITTGNFKEMIFYFPSKDEQKIIGNYFRNIDVLISNHKIQINQLQNIKKAFLAKMFI